MGCQVDIARVEVITIGDELLSGRVVNTNASFIGEHLMAAGLEPVYQSAVGDSGETILQALSAATGRANIILTTGGLGPTHDDITKKILCKFFKRQLVFHEELLKELQEKYARQGLNMPPINQNQALLPQGAKFLENKIGSALGIVIEEDGRVLIAMPGVPSEMKMMLTEQAIPYLKQRFQPQFIVQRKLRTIGIIESAIFEKTKDIIEDKTPVKIAFLPSFRGVDIGLTVKADSLDQAQKSVDGMQTRFEEKIGKYVFGYDHDELPMVLGRLLKERKATLAVAESCTGGMLGKLLTDVSGSSEYFLGGIIAYSDAIKMKILNVPTIVIERHGAVSSETAKYMAEGVAKLAGSSIGLAITGIAGPGGATPEKPLGLTYISLVTPEGTTAREYHFGENRCRVRLRASYAALDLIRRYLVKIE